VAYSPLGRGFLIGRFQDSAGFEEGDFRGALPRFQTATIASNKRIADLVGRIAARKGCTSAQLSLAWLLAQGDSIVPIPGTKRVVHLRDNVGALDVSLSATDLEEIKTGLADFPVAGARYTEEGMKGVDA